VNGKSRQRYVKSAEGAVDENYEKDLARRENICPQPLDHKFGVGNCLREALARELAQRHPKSAFVRSVRIQRLQRYRGGLAWSLLRSDL
jgi:hypothetical protein